MKLHFRARSQGDGLSRTTDRGLPAASVVGRIPSLKEPLLDGGRLFWLEQRPHEQGRSTLMVRPTGSGPTGSKSGLGDGAIELSPNSWNLRSRVHEYGGGVFAVKGQDLVVIHDGDRCPHHLQLDPVSGAPQGDFRRLVAPADRAFADGLIDPGRRRWLGVMEAGGIDQLVAIPLAGGEPQLLHQPADFCGYPALSPDGRHLAWVTWQQPAMPWQRSQLWLAELNGDGQLGEAQAIAGAGPDGPEAISVFQPLWITPAGAPPELVFSSDVSGWWNLQRFRPGSPQGEALLTMEAEFGMPQWVYGMRTTAWDGSQLIAATCHQGEWQLGRLDLAPERVGTPAAWQPIEQPFNDLAALSAEGGRLVCVASNPSSPSGLLELEISSGQWQHRPVAPNPLPAGAISPPEALWFAGFDDQPTHAWYYPPTAGASANAPLLVKSHSGPTAMARTGLNLAIQFWTSRGWGVVDVNYGGSTGFGRAYRQRLDGQWGVVDVADCAAAARALVAAAKADPQRIAIEGGSAGGFTTLAALCFSDVFRAGACRYGVADLGALAADSHRFEAHYLDSLVGPWPAAKDTYLARSPLQHADQMSCPVIFFQGLDDRVVPAEQTEQMAAALKAKGIAVEVHLFAGEGHGFKQSSTQIKVLEATEAFFAKHFAPPAGANAP
ncbi:S9 family peptidase [Cyanobium sp. WAJ14-Wanaka]|nr:S9 family peptidase [Cyanobium sp. WAJ14-Wanaka]